MLPFSNGAFIVYVVALVIELAGGFAGLVLSHHPAFLAPILMGLFYFYLCWEATVGRADELPPRSKDGA